MGKCNRRFTPQLARVAVQLVTYAAWAILALGTLPARPAGADIYYLYPRSGVVIPGTQGITPGPGIDLSGWNTPGHQLESANFQHMDLTGATFANSDLVNADFRTATLTNANFTGALVNGVSFGAGNSSITASQLYSTASYQERDLSRVEFLSVDLTGWSFAYESLEAVGFLTATLTYADFSSSSLKSATFDRCVFSGASFYNSNLKSAKFYNSTFSNADFSGAIINGTWFFSSPISAAQLYSTRSYASHDLTQVALVSMDVSGWNFANQNLAGAVLRGAVLTNTDFTGADLRGDPLWQPLGSTILRNTIWPDGSIHGLALLAGETLVVRENAKSVTVATSATFDLAATLDLQLTPQWHSVIRFGAGVVPSLGGTLDVEFAPGISFTPTLGQSFHLFTWANGLTGSFAHLVLPPLPAGLSWNASHLYTSGDLSVVGAGDLNGDNVVNGLDISLLVSHWLKTGTGLAGDGNNDGVINGLDISLVASHWLHPSASAASATAVPEPSGLLLALCGGLLLALRRCGRVANP